MMEPERRDPEKIRHVDGFFPGASQARKVNSIVVSNYGNEYQMI